MPIRSLLLWGLCLWLIGSAPAGWAAGAALQEAAAETSATELPPDVNPDSRSRLPMIRREEMDEEGQRVYDRFVGPQSRSLAGLQGPLGIWLHSPEVGELMHAANELLRFDSGLEGRIRELAILVTAREMDSQVEWTAHEPVALQEGLDPEIIDVIKHRQGVEGLGEKEALIIQYGREMFRETKVSSETFAQALKLFGKKGLVDLTSLMGCYSMTAFLIRAFDLQLRPGQQPLLPLP